MPNKTKSRKVILEEKNLHGQWCNIISDMPNSPAPVIHPVTKKPIGPEDLAPLFPMELIKQEVSGERWIDIPEEVSDCLNL